MGLHNLSWIRLPLSKVATLSTDRLKVAGAFGGGFLLSLVIAPCGTPVLASVLSYAAYERRVPYGALLLSLYGFGTGLPVLLVGTAAGRLAQKLERKGYRLWVDRATGVLLLGSGSTWCGPHELPTPPPVLPVARVRGSYQTSLSRVERAGIHEHTRREAARSSLVESPARGVEANRVPSTA